ncbi:hypothetical protein CALCODRAFT_488513 [Calocera cornea HHB12733]|uniref:Uncharacterized protein n=1 Tax=Calocera cornea HHB12733 TaxID=1353952 RepID=A0A165CET2_9BASI|nr:hypothetical protein CALCODRAFT_488513 [Calocera cornea HHB12733]
MNGAWVGIYVDGKGMVPGTRASTYCTACRDTYDISALSGSQEAPNSSHDGYS